MRILSAFFTQFYDSSSGNNDSRCEERMETFSTYVDLILGFSLSLDCRHIQSKQIIIVFLYLTTSMDAIHCHDYTCRKESIRLLRYLNLELSYISYA